MSPPKRFLLIVHQGLTLVSQVQKKEEVSIPISEAGGILSEDDRCTTPHVCA